MPIGFDKNTINRYRQQLAHEPVLWLKWAITIWALLVLFIVWFVVDNAWLLAAILLYEVLP
jgi:cell division septal protein FtsQ